MESAERRLHMFGRTIEHVGRSLAALGAAIFAPFALAGRATQQIGKQIQDAADKAGGSIEIAGRKMGFNAEESRSAVEFADAMEEVETTGKRLVVTVGGALLPVLRRFTNWFTENSVMVRTWIKNNETLIQGVVAFGAGLLGAGIALMVVGKVALGVSHGIKLLTIGLGAFQAVAGLLLSPVGLLIVGIGAIAVAVYALTTNFGELGKDWGETWNTMVDAVKAGNLEAAFKVVGAQLRFEWAKVVAFWTEKLDRFGLYFREVGRGFELVFSDIGKSFTINMSRLAEFLGLVPAGTTALLEKDAAKDRNRILDESKKDLMGAGRVNPDLAAARAEVDRARAERDAARANARRPGGLRAPLEGGLMSAIAEQAKGLFSSSALSQSLAVSDKLGEKIKEGVERAAQAGEALLDWVKKNPGAQFV